MDAKRERRNWLMPDGSTVYVELSIPLKRSTAERILKYAELLIKEADIWKEAEEMKPLPDYSAEELAKLVRKNMEETVAALHVGGPPPGPIRK